MALWRRKPKRTEVVGLDIGSSAVKVVELRPTGESYELVGFGMAPVPVGSIQGGEIRQAAAVQQAIRQALAQGGIQATDTVIGVSGGAVRAQRGSLPELGSSGLSGP